MKLAPIHKKPKQTSWVVLLFFLNTYKFKRYYLKLDLLSNKYWIPLPRGRRLPFYCLIHLGISKYGSRYSKLLKFSSKRFLFLYGTLRKTFVRFFIGIAATFNSRLFYHNFKIFSFLLFLKNMLMILFFGSTSALLHWANIAWSISKTHLFSTKTHTHVQKKCYRTFWIIVHGTLHLLSFDSGK